MSGYEITPVITETEDGKQVVTDFSVNGGNVTGRDGSYQGWNDDFIEDSEGRIQYKYENWVDESVQQESLYNDTDYWNAVMDSDPLISDALDWATNDFFTEEQAKSWDSMIENGTDEEIHNALERLKNQYLEAGGLPRDVEESQETDSDPDEPTDEQREQVYEIAQELMQAEPDLDSADGWDEVGMEALQSGDEVYSAICSMTASFNRGEIGAQEAIEAIVNQYPISDVERCWKYIQENS